MLTNHTTRFEMNAAARPTTLWSSVATPGVSVYCLGSIPTIPSVGGVQKQGQIELNSLLANFDSRQLQM